MLFRSGKLFEYIGTGRPVLGIGPKHGAAAKIINECEAGELFSRDEEKEIYQFLKDKVAAWLNGKEDSVPLEKRKKYTRRSLAEQLSKIIRS